MRMIDLISPAYAEEQRRLHARPEPYGHRGYKWAQCVREIVRERDCWSILDYGCGAGALARALQEPRMPGVRISEYDPAIKGKDYLPEFADLVVCTDVLEHVEPERLDAVLKHLRMLARKAVFVVIATIDTANTLSDGRSTHLMIQPGDWWRQKMHDAGFIVFPPPACARKCDEKEWIAVLLP